MSNVHTAVVPPRDRPQFDLSPAAIVFAGFVAVAALLVLAGLAAPWLSPDSYSWLHPCAGRDGCLGGARTPFYGWLVSEGITPGITVFAQFDAMLLAALLLCRAVENAGGSRAAACAVGLAVAFSNITLLWAHALLPEAFSFALLLAGFACSLERRPVPAGLAVALACLLKPGLLPFVAGVPLFHLAVQGWRGLPSLVAAIFAPLAGWALLRLLLVGSGNIVSFGGFQMSGIAALMLAPDVVPRLPVPMRELAWQIIARRDDLIAAGTALPLPTSSHGGRSFLSAATGYFDIMARTYDPILYGAVGPARLRFESWVSFDARMQHLSLAVLAASPVAYAGWIAGGMARVLGRLLMFEPTITLPGALCLVLPRRSPWPEQDRAILVPMAACWAACSILPAVMLSFPAARYIDGAALLVAVLPLFELLRRIRALRERDIACQGAQRGAQ